MIKESRVLLNPSIAWTIIKNTPSLDPLVILLNSKIYCLKNRGKIVSFLTIKKWKDSVEIGTVYTYPEFRNKGLAKKLIKYAIKKHKKVGLICKKNLVQYYKKAGFKISNSTKNRIEKRKELFNRTLSKIFGYKLAVMRN